MFLSVDLFGFVAMFLFSLQILHFTLAGGLRAPAFFIYLFIQFDLMPFFRSWGLHWSLLDMKIVQYMWKQDIQLFFLNNSLLLV